MRGLTASLAALLLIGGLGFAREAAHMGGDDGTPNPLQSWQLRIDDGGLAQSSTTPAPTPAPPPVTTPPADTTPPAVEPPEDGEPGTMPGDEFSLGDLPAVETVELTPDMAKRAIDSYLLVREKYKDAALENFENLQDFVDQAPQGKAFEADVKAAGFANVTEWNTVITTISFAYANLIDDQTEEIRQQIEEIKADTEMAQDMRDRMITALQAMIPSDNNKTVVQDLLKDPVYGGKLKTFEMEEE